MSGKFDRRICERCGRRGRTYYLLPYDDSGKVQLLCSPCWGIEHEKIKPPPLVLLGTPSEG
jgi:hypothetical protein